MIDAALQGALAPTLAAVGRKLARRGVSANAVTALGAALVIPLVAALASGAFHFALVLIAANRLLDGLDGAVARATRSSPLGGYLDIVADYVFYAGVPLGFALAAPESNALAAAALLASFLLTASSFLAWAALAAQHGLAPDAGRPKAFFYSRGLVEGAETLAFFVAMALWPAHFAPLAWLFAALCALTALQRTALAVARFR